MTGILLSGGIDSASLAYWKRPEIAFTVEYGQQCAEAEVRSASSICVLLGMKHEVISVDCSQLGSGDLAGKVALDCAPVREWWPYRNQLILTLASMRGLAVGVGRLLVGSVAEDSVHVDGTKKFYESIDHLVSMQEGNLRIEVPAIGLSSVELVHISGITIAELGWTHSCHVSNYPCGRCRGCLKHRSIMEDLGYEHRATKKSVPEKT